MDQAQRELGTDMNSTMAVTLFRFVGLLLIFGLVALLGVGLNFGIGWLTIAVSVVIGIMGLGTLFICLYVVAARGD